MNTPLVFTKWLISHPTKIFFMRHLILTIALLTSINCFAQNSLGFSFDDGKQFVELSFKDESNLIVVPILVNGQGPFNFILDTGSESGMIFDRFVIADNNLANARTIPIYAGNGDKITDLAVASNLNIKLNGISGKDQSMLVLEESGTDIRNVLGVEAHGILGSELFNRFVVEVDYENEKLRLYEPDKFKAPKGFRKVDVDIRDFRPYMKTQIKQKGQRKKEMSLLIDTGASSALFLDQERHDEIVLPKHTINHSLGSSLIGELEGKVGRVQGLRFGKRFRFSKVVTSYPENWQVKTVVDGVEGNARQIKRYGTIGSDVLSRFNIIFDYLNEAIYLKKNENYGNTFKFNTAGFTFSVTGEELNRYFISKIIPTSPAADLGLLPGDEIISIGDKPVFFYSFASMNSLLRQPSGTKLTIIIKRDGELIEKKLELRNLI